MTYEGPAFAQLCLLHELSALLALRCALAAIRGDALTLLRLQRFARFGFDVIEAARASGASDPVGGWLSRAEPTQEALEDLCFELAAVAFRLDRAGEAAKDVGHSLWVLRTEVRAAHRHLALLLRQAARLCLRDDAQEDAQEVRAWICYLEGRDGDAEPQPAIRPGLAPPPLASLRPFAAAGAGDGDLRLLVGPERPGAPAGAASRARSQTMILIYCIILLQRDIRQHYTGFYYHNMSYFDTGALRP